MEHKLYEAACNGDIKHIQKITEQLNLLVTPMKNTVLHVNIAFSHQPSASFVDQVLEICPRLLLQVNDCGETPLHVAAKKGVVAIVHVLIKHAKAQHQDLEAKETAVKEMLRMTNNDGNTALHEAAQNCNLVELVKLLMREDDDFPYDSVNNDGETTLYIAVSRGFLGVVVEMLKTCTSTTYNYKGPRRMTILHAAVRRNHPGITRKILEKKYQTKEANEDEWSLTKEMDGNGWTSLHYAAYYDHRLIVKLLLEFDASAASIADSCRKMTALHLATGRGHYHISDMIINSCPTCIEQVDNRGWNYVHFGMCNVIAVTGGLRQYHWPDYLLNAKDIKGNTPLFVLASINPFAFHLIKNIVRREFIASTNHSIHYRKEQIYQLQNEISKLSKIRHEPYTKGVLRLNNPEFDELCRSLEKEREMYLIVVALIATVTFTAGLTVPGGYIQEDSNKGTAVLIKNLAFQVFVISDAIALVLSVLAVHFHIVRRFFQEKRFLLLIYCAHLFTSGALTAMVIAFITGTYAILRPSLGLAIIIVMIGLSYFLVYFFLACKFRFL